MSDTDFRGIEALLFDFGGVVVHIDFDWVFRRWAELSGAPFEQIKSRFSHGEAYQRHERGEIDMAAYCESLRRDLGIDLSDDQFIDGWQRVFGAEIPATVAALPKLKGRIPLYLFSNTNFTHHAYWSARYEKALQPFDASFVSYRMGVRKPEPEAFEQVARDTGVPLDRIRFLDDTQANIDAAAALGIDAVLVRSAADIQRALSPWRAAA